MIPRTFEALFANSIPDAIDFLQQHKGEAKILAGGHSLIPLMKLRLVSPAYVVDINNIPDLSYIKEENGHVLIGGLTRHVEVETSELLKMKLPILPETAFVIGDPQVRNLGTMAGVLAHADPSGDYGAVMLALEAEFTIVGPGGKRSIKATEFFVDLFTTKLEDDELLTEIRLPLQPPRSGGTYLKLERRVGDFAIVGVAAQLTLDDNNICKSVGIGLTAVGSTPLKAAMAEKALIGQELDDEHIKIAADKASTEASPTSDLRGSQEYKREMVRVFVKRALTKAKSNALGKGNE